MEYSVLFGQLNFTGSEAGTETGLESETGSTTTLEPTTTTTTTTPTPEPAGFKKVGNVSTGCPAKLFPLGYLLFCRFLLMQIAKVGSFMNNSGNLLQDRHKNFEN